MIGAAPVTGGSGYSTAPATALPCGHECDRSTPTYAYGRGHALDALYTGCSPTRGPATTAEQNQDEEVWNQSEEKAMVGA